MLSVLQNLHHSIFLEKKHSWRGEHNIQSPRVYFLITMTRLRYY